MCDKVRFSKNKAEQMVKGKKLGAITKKKFRIYLCPECHYYHLTTGIDM